MGYLMFEPVTDEAQLRRAFGCFPSGIAAVCAEVDGMPVGVAASSFTSVSMEPPLVSVNMRHASTTWPLLRTGRRLGLSVLSEGQEGICRQLAGNVDHRFSEATWWGNTDGGIFIEGATLWLDCSIHAEVPAGDHDVVLLRIHGLRIDPDSAPLVFHNSRFRRLATA
jgi:flavin reductase (DIM6/NTAB) family NADH-FMN oxidoreductase RutF